MKGFLKSFFTDSDYHERALRQHGQFMRAQERSNELAAQRQADQQAYREALLAALNRIAGAIEGHNR